MDRQNHMRWLGPVLLLLQLAVTLLLGRQAGKLVDDNSIERFAVAHQASERAYAEFLTHFEPARYFLVTLVYTPGQHAAGAEAVFAQLAALPGIRAHLSLGSLFPDGQGAAEAVLPFPFVVPERGCTSAIFQFDPAQNPDHTLTAVIAAGEAIAGSRNDGPQQVVVAGEAVVNHYLNLSSLEVKQRLFPALVILAVLLLGAFFRSIKVLLISGLSVATALAATMGGMALAGRTLNLVTILVPSLVFVLSVAMNMHVLFSIARCGNTLAGLRAKLVPNILVSATTSLGFASLLSSKVEPIAATGGMMAIGVWLIFLAVHLSYLSLAHLLDLRVSMPILPFRLVSRSFYQRLIATPTILVPACLAILAGAFVLYHNPMESNGLNYFDRDNPIRRDTAFLERNVTGSSQLELLIKRVAEPQPEDDAWIPPFEETRAFEKALLGLPGIRHLLSLGAFAEANDEEAAHPIELDEELLTPYFSKDYYRIQLLVDSMGKEEYDAVRGRILDLAKASGIEGEFLITGTLDRVIEIQRYLLDSLARSLVITVLTVVALLILLLDRKYQFFVILLPNLFPLGCMALAMAVFRFPTTVSSVMVFSIAFGIAVDDSIHLLHTYHEHPKGSFRQRWRFAMHHDARAISLTTLVLTLGFMVLALSHFSPTRDFGILLSLGMIFAFLGDVVFLPALLRLVYRPGRT